MFARTITQLPFQIKSFQALILLLFYVWQLLLAGSSPRLLAEHNSHYMVMHAVEGLALLLLCSLQVVTRKLGVTILKEVRLLTLSIGQNEVRAVGF